MNPDVDFQRWLEIMARRAANINSSKPIVGKYAGRRVWFWRDGTTLMFDLDQDGYVTTPVNDPANVKPVGMSRKEHVRWYWTEGPGALRLKNLPLWQQKMIMEDILKPSERETVTNQKLSRAAVVQQQLKALQAELAHLARFPEDNFADGTVLQVVKTYKRHVLTPTETGRFRVDPNNSEIREDRFTYVLLKANGQWWCTGQNGHQINGASWDKVIEFVDGDELIDVRTGLSVMTDAAVPLNDRDRIADMVEEAAAKAPTLVDVLGEEQAAKVQEFLDNPETGVKMDRPKRSEPKSQYQEGEYLRPTLRATPPRPTRDES